MFLIVASSLSIYFKLIISWLANDFIYKAVFLFLSPARKEKLRIKAEKSILRGFIRGLLIKGVSRTISRLLYTMALLLLIVNYT